MKKITFLTVLLALVFCKTNAQSTDQTILPVTFENKKLEATIVCLDAIENPNKYNEFAKSFIADPTFPKVANSHDELSKEINLWLINHPLIVDQIVIERKKAHDKLYGYRPY